MAYPNYVEPQLNIAQVLEDTGGSLVSRLNATVLGRHFLLSRYGLEEVPSYLFSSAGYNIPFETVAEDASVEALDSSYVVDEDHARIYGDDLHALLASFTDGFTLDSLAQPNIIKIGSGAVGGTGLNAAFHGRDTEVGDVVVVDDGVTYTGNNVIERTVVGLLGVDTAASYGVNVDSDNSEAANSDYNPTEIATQTAVEQTAVPGGWTMVVDQTSLQLNERGSSLLEGLYGEEFTITVRAGGAPGVATVDIASRSGLYSKAGVATVAGAGDSFDILAANAAGELAGVDVNLDGPLSLTQGQIFKFKVYQAYEALDTTGTKHLTVSDSGLGYTGATDTTYVITVTTGSTGGTFAGAEVRISDTAGVEPSIQTGLVIVDDTEFAVGSYGLEAKFTYGVGVDHLGLRAGDIYYVHAKAPSQSGTVFDKVVLDGPVADTTLFTDVADTLPTVSFRIPYSGVVLTTDAAAGTAWELDTINSQYVVDAGLSLYVADRDASYKWVAFADAQGTLNPYFRALVPPASTEGRITITSPTDIVDNFGAIDIENDLAFGASEMLSGAQGRAITAMRVSADTAEAYAEALRSIESTDLAYAICPLSNNSSVAALVTSHCEAMSVKTIKNFRRAYIGVDSPGTYQVLGLNPDDDSAYTATVQIYGTTALHVTCEEVVDFTTMGLVSGDYFRMSGVDYRIDEVLGATELLLLDPTPTPVSPAVPFELWKADTADSQVDFIAERANALASRRAVLVWNENGTRLIGDVATPIPAMYIAAEVAGLRIAVPPQQGLTRTEITSVTNSPAMFTRYNREDLNRAASNGVFIVTQEVEDGDIFIRHQLTTQPNSGLLHFEDSVGTNLDDICFKIKDALTGFIGRKNVNSQTLLEIETTVFDILADATLSEVNSQYGPQLSGFRDLTVAADATLKDRVNVTAIVEIPLPLNVLEVTLTATQDLDLIGTGNTLSDADIA